MDAHQVAHRLVPHKAVAVGRSVPLGGDSPAVRVGAVRDELDGAYLMRNDRLLLVVLMVASTHVPMTRTGSTSSQVTLTFMDGDRGILRSVCMLSQP